MTTDQLRERVAGAKLIEQGSAWVKVHFRNDEDAAFVCDWLRALALLSPSPRGGEGGSYRGVEGAPVSERGRHPDWDVLRVLSEKATAGPWRTAYHQGEAVLIHSAAPGEGMYVALTATAARAQRVGGRDAANAAFIVALVNWFRSGLSAGVSPLSDTGALTGATSDPPLPTTGPAGTGLDRAGEG